jgi:hypothetical protein
MPETTLAGLIGCHRYILPYCELTSPLDFYMTRASSAQVQAK